MPFQTVKFIQPRKLSVFSFTNEVRKILHDIGEEVINDLIGTTDWWDGDKPFFDKLVILKGGALTLEVGPVGSGFGSRKWIWLDEGTSVRYAKMPRDFIPKTTPGTLRTGPGSLGTGRPFIDVLNPAPGIEAREWTTLTQKKHGPRAKRQIEGALRRNKNLFRSRFGR